MASSTLESDQQILARSNKKREDSKSNKQKTSGTVGQLISREKVQQQNIQPRTTRKSPGFGSSIVNQVDSARVRIKLQLLQQQQQQQPQQQKQPQQQL